MLSAIRTGVASSGTRAASTGIPLLDLKLAQAHHATDVKLEAQPPQVGLEIKAFKTTVASAPNIRTALENPDMQKVLLTANGLSRYIRDTALVQKMFLSDRSNCSSLANQLVTTLTDQYLLSQQSHRSSGSSSGSRLKSLAVQSAGLLV